MMLERARLGLGLLVGSTGLVAALVLVLALSPPYTGLGSGLAPSTLWLPLQTTVFRRAVVNTLVLAVGVVGISLFLGQLWARVGVPLTPAGRAVTLLPFRLPGVMAALLWRPWLAPSLVLAQAELNLALTGAIFIWQATPAVAFWLDRHGTGRRTLLQAVLFPLLLVLLTAGVPLALTGGEPFNAAHTWASWSLQTLWVTHNWGEAAAMRGALALLIAVLVIFVVNRLHHTSPPNLSPPAGRYSLRWFLAVLWSAGPFVLWLPRLRVDPVATWSHLWVVGVPFWFIWWGVVLVVTSYVALRLTRRLAVVACPLCGSLGLGLIALWPVALAYLRHLLPWLNVGLLLVIPWTITATLLGLAAPQYGRRWHVHATLVVLLLAHGFGLELVLDASAWWTLPATGTVRHLASGAPSALAWVLVLQAVVALGAAWTVARVTRDPPVQ